VLTQFIQQMISNEIMPSFTPPAELDVKQYSEDILARFRNPAIRHLLAQIAWDGSQKLPMRILPAISDNLATGKPIDKLAFAIAAWCRFIVKRYSDNEKLVDPLAEQLLAVAAQCSGNTDTDVALFLAVDAVFPAELSLNKTFFSAVHAAYQQLVSRPAAALAAFTGVV
jgi:fructuronate reductase